MLFIFLLPEQKKNETKRKFAVCIFLPTPALFSAKEKELAIAQTAFSSSRERAKNSSRSSTKGRSSNGGLNIASLVDVGVFCFARCGGWFLCFACCGGCFPLLRGVGVCDIHLCLFLMYGVDVFLHTLSPLSRREAFTPTSGAMLSLPFPTKASRSGLFFLP